MVRRSRVSASFRGRSIRTSRISGQRVAQEPREVADQQSATSGCRLPRETWVDTRGVMVGAVARVVKPSVTADANQAADRHREVAAPKDASAGMRHGAGARTNTARHEHLPAGRWKLRPLREPCQGVVSVATMAEKVSPVSPNDWEKIYDPSSTRRGENMLQTIGFLATIRTGGTMDRHAHNLVVVGSSPTRPTNPRHRLGQVACSTRQ